MIEEQDFNKPLVEADYRSAFVCADYSSTDPTYYSDWIAPGDKYFRTACGLNSDNSVAVEADITVARLQWEGLTFEQRYGIRLHHESVIKRVDGTGDIFIYYFTEIPADVFLDVQAATDAECYYLGSTFSDAATVFTGMYDPGIWAEFWPTDTMDQVISGWESDAA